MRTCPQCGTSVPDEAQWCGTCYLPFAPAPSTQIAFNGVVMPRESPPAPIAPDPVVPAAPAPVVAIAPPPQYAAPMPSPSVPVSAPVDGSPWAAPAGAPAFGGAPLPPPGPGWAAAAPLQRVGWQAPAGPAPWGPPPFAPASDPVAEGRLLSGRALVIVVISIAFGGVMQLAIYLLSRDSHLNPDTLIRTAIVATLVVYALVGTLLVSQITPEVRLRWGEGSVVLRVATGLVVGSGLSGLLLWIVSSARGHLSPDPNVLLMMSTGDAGHIIVVTLLTCAAAPIVEETLFRGLLLESLRQHQLGMAIVVSSLFFAVWHFNPRGALYYTILGAVLAGVYVKRGLVASMAAHFGFNGVLTVAAISIVLGPSHTYAISGLQLTAPGTWAQVNTHSSIPLNIAPDLVLQGPDAAEVAVFSHASTGSDDLTQLSQNIAPAPGLGGVGSGPQQIQLPHVGAAIETTVTEGSKKAEFVVFQSGGEDYLVIFGDNGSTKADGDFTKMLDSLQPSLGPVS